MKQICLPHIKNELHSHYAAWAYKPNIFSHIYQSTTNCNSCFTHNCQICAKNKCALQMPYMTHIPISSSTDIKQLCQYIYLILTQCNQQCDQKHCYTYTSHYLHMPLNKYACHILYVCPIALILYFMCRPNSTTHTNQKQQTATFIYLTVTLYVPTTNMPLKYHIYATDANYFICTYDIAMSVYIPHMNSMQSIM